MGWRQPFRRSGPSEGGSRRGSFSGDLLLLLRAGASAETIARFRKSLRLLSQLAEIKDDEPLDPELEGGSLPEEWRLNGASARPPGRIATVCGFRAPASREVAATGDGSAAHELGINDLDFSDLTGRERRVTQNVANASTKQRTREARRSSMGSGTSLA